MSTASFTRDEVILALDVLYSMDGGRVSAKSPQMYELSALLNRLPIHPLSKRKERFRTSSGIVQQLNLFQKSFNCGEKHEDVGKMFIDIAIEFENRTNALHEIAEAIRCNELYYTSEFGETSEDEFFPEGILLGHLHRVMETRLTTKIPLQAHCEICNLQPNLYYQPCGNLLQHHLLVPPEKMDGKKKYSTESFITVCPTCHAVLHRYRPWCTRDNCGELLR